MKNNITELVFIIDRSGSMAGLESDTAGGFNSVISKQRENDGKCYVSTVLFNSAVTTLHDRVELNSISDMTPNDCRAIGSTSLCDAIGETVKHISDIHKYIRPEDVPERTMFVITTDGYENSSTKYTNEEIKKMINEKKESNNWEFLFVGANIDSFTTAQSFGIDANRVANYIADPKGTRVFYNTVASTVSHFMKSDSLSDAWSDDIKKDYKERKK